MYQIEPPRRPVEHSMHRRARWHDYSGKGLYMVTIVVSGRRQLLGALLCDPKPRVEASPLGARIVKEELPKISKHYPNVEVWKTVVMPDHIHFIFYVKEPFERKRSLGNVISGFKSGCGKAYRLMYGEGVEPLFEKGYNDRVLKNIEQMERWKRYLADNPRRLWIKRSNPQYFTEMAEEVVAETTCRLFGNRFLLDIPDKVPVIYHRHYTDADLAALYAEYMACGENGGVLVSAAIAPWEKKVMREAMDLGYSVILLRDNGFPKLYKPAGEAFDACARGQLLQLSPWEYNPRKETITRAKCLALNRLAEAIAGV